MNQILFFFSFQANTIQKWTELDKTKIHKVVQLTELFSKETKSICFRLDFLRSDGRRGKVFSPRPMVGRILAELERGFSAYFVPMGKETKGAKSYNR